MTRTRKALIGAMFAIFTGVLLLDARAQLGVQATSRLE